MIPDEHIDRLDAFYRGRCVCVTGGCGFIGGHLVDALVGLGARVGVIDDLSNSSASHIGSLMERDPERVGFVHGSILDDAALRDAMEPMRGPRRAGDGGVVFHLAARSSVPASIESPERTHAVNAVGTVRVAQAARDAGAARVVYSASSSAYGDGEGLPKRERDLPDPLSPYASSKLAGEHTMRAWSGSFGLSTVSLRYFNVFGPRQRSDSAYAAVIASFARALLSGEPATIYGDGLQSRDFTYVRNAVVANLLAGACQTRLKGQVVNVGAGQRTDLLTLHKLMAGLCGVPHAEPVHAEARVGDVRHSQADIALARELFGYRPVVDLEEGLEKTVAWYSGLLADAS